MSVHWQCPDCHDYLGDYQVQEPYCDRCKRHGKMRFSEPSEIATLRAQLADAVAFVRKAGHLPGCEALLCIAHDKLCGCNKASRIHWEPAYPWFHDFQPGECTCGLDRIVGSEGE